MHARRALAITGLAAAFAGAACAPAAPAPSGPAPVAVAAEAPAPAPRPSIPVSRADAGAVRRLVEPATALARGWMPLASTRVPEFLTDHPAHDGRGVIIAILDSGVDPAVEGLETTTTGARKLLDIRDFSGEGEISLEALIPDRDTIAPGLAGGAALRELSPGGRWYVGRIIERTLGAAPAADLNGNGTATDTLPLIVAEDGDGWFVLADTDLDGTLAGERPVRDFARNGDILGWARFGAVPPLGVAVNLPDKGGEPRLGLVLDTGGHGTHVAGIAAGHRIYDVEGLNGVAPGAQLIGLKISNNAHGSVSTTGSMIAAMDHAIRFAAARRQPLVLNLSFGVGNEEEGTARIDALVDSVLAANPAVVFTISAGNDGPGLSTVGFPGSASRAISVGATVPAVFLAPPGGDARPDAVASFSARGGEVAKPDILAPGVAYSTVPRWNAGRERNGGTSMAAPHAAGLAALLLSALAHEGRTADAVDIRAALAASAEYAGPAVTGGAGVPNVVAAWEWLRSGRRAPTVTARVAGEADAAALHQLPGGAEAPAGQRFEIVRPAGASRATYRLRSDVPWILTPDSIVAAAGITRLEVAYDTAIISRPGAWTGAVSGWSADTADGPQFTLLNTVVSPHAAGAAVRLESGDLPPSAGARVFFIADSGRGFRISAAGSGSASVSLHEPGGRPYRDAAARPAGTPTRPVTYDVDASDVEGGAYELVMTASPLRSASVSGDVEHAPVRLMAARKADSVITGVTSLSTDTLSGESMLLLLGAERTIEIRSASGNEVRVPVEIPEWAVRAAVDVRHPRGQWGRFTDFGVTLFTDDGRVIEQSPLNYSFGRLAFELTPDAAGNDAVLSLLPGLAEARSDEWGVAVSIRFYAAEPVAVAPLAPEAGDRQEPAFRLAPSSSLQISYPYTSGPWQLAEGFHPLAVLVADIDGVTWSREIGIGGPANPDPR